MQYCQLIITSIINRPFVRILHISMQGPTISAYKAISVINADNLQYISHDAFKYNKEFHLLTPFMQYLMML